MYSLMGAGLCGLNGQNPKVSLHLMQIYAVPRLLHGLEALVLATSEVKQLESYYRDTLRKLQHLPQSTATCAIYLLVGAIPLEGLLDTRRLTFFGSVARRKGSVEYDVVERQLAVKDLSSSSWTVSVRKTLDRYNLPSAHELLVTCPSKTAWKCTVKQAIQSYWSNKLWSEAADKSSLAYLRLEYMQLYTTHPVWDTALSSPTCTLKAMVQAKLLVQRYPLMSSRTAGDKYGNLCPLCNQEEETLSHFLLICPRLSQIRTNYMNKISNICHCNIYILDVNTQVGLLLNTVHTMKHLDWRLDSMGTSAVCGAARDICFKLHSTRSSILGIRTQLHVIK